MKIIFSWQGKSQKEGIVLLKNEGNTLPLAKTGTKLAVIGPNANHIYNQLGDYTSPQPREQIVTVLDGIMRKLGADSGQVLYAPGCRIKGDSREGFAQALACAEQADVIVMVMGGSSARDFGEGTIDLRTGASVVTDDPWNDMECGEGIDRASLNLMGVQLELVQEVHKLGNPLSLCILTAAPLLNLGLISMSMPLWKRGTPDRKVVTRLRIFCLAM